MVGFTESAKCVKVKKIFDDAYRYEKKIIFISLVLGFEA